MFGNVCGVDAAVKSRPYEHFAFFAPDGDTSVSLCVDYCPMVQERVFMYTKEGVPNSAYVLAPATEPVMKECFPTADVLSATGKGVVRALKTRLSRIHAISDIATAWELIFTALLASAAAAAIVQRTGPRAPRRATWVAIAALAAATAAATVVCTWRISEAARLHGADFPAVASLRAAAIAALLAGFCFAQLLFCFNLLPRILTGAEAARATRGPITDRSGALLACSAAASAVAALLAAYWVHIALYILTSADVVSRQLDADKYQVGHAMQVQWDAGWARALLLHTATVAVALRAALALHRLIVSRLVAGWFFAAEQPQSAAATAAGVLRYHTGTAVLHASISLLLSPPRAGFAALRAAAPVLRLLSTAAETRFVLAMDFLVAATGYEGPLAMPVAAVKALAYRDAVNEAHRLGAKSPRLAAAIDRCTWVGPELWAAAVAGLAGTAVLVSASVDKYYVYGTDWEPPLSSPLWPAVFTAVAGYCVASPIIGTVRSATDTLAVCCMVDADECGGGRAQSERRNVAGELERVSDDLEFAGMSTV